MAREGAQLGTQLLQVRPIQRTALPPGFSDQPGVLVEQSQHIDLGQFVTPPPADGQLSRELDQQRLLGGHAQGEFQRRLPVREAATDEVCDILAELLS